MDGCEYILEELLKIPGAKTTGSMEQIRIPCPICHHKEPKLYVGVMNGSRLLGYDCKHCQFQGKVGPEFLKLFGITSDAYLRSYKSAKFSARIIPIVGGNFKLDLHIPNRILDEDKFKMDYLSIRLGRKVNKNDLVTYKIVLNLNDFYKFNNYDPYQKCKDRDEKERLRHMIDEYSKNFVGMLSYDNNKVNLRNLTSRIFRNKRYMVHVIDKDISNPYMYIPSVPIDLMSKNPVINMSEGNYDIICAKEKFFLNEDNSNMFVAVGTKKAYKRVLMQILKMTGFLNAKINIFADNDPDSSLDMYREMFAEERPLFDKINIIYNRVGKDFGDLSKPIEAVKCTI